MTSARIQKTLDADPQLKGRSTFSVRMTERTRCGPYLCEAIQLRRAGHDGLPCRNGGGPVPSATLGNDLIKTAGAVAKRILPSPIVEVLRRVGRKLSHKVTLPADKRAVLFCTTNGVGLGHVSRALAIARALRTARPDLDILFMVSTPNVSIVRDAGFIGYYIPTPEDLKHIVGWRNWDMLLAVNLRRIFDMHKVGAFVFDGYSPFDGIRMALTDRPHVRRVWTRRGLVKGEHAAKPNSREGWFEFLIRPKEAGELIPDFDNRTVSTAPIIALGPDDALSREAAREALGVPEGAQAFYVQLGGGVREPIAATIDALLDCLDRREDIFVILAVSMLKSDITERRPLRGVVLSNYPNARYFSGIDAAISAAGYNTVHELLAFRVPTLFLPRVSSSDADDQPARARIAVEAGAARMITVGPGDEEFASEIDAAIDALEDPSQRARMAESAAALLPTLGAADAAAFIASLVPKIEVAPPPETDRIADCRRRMTGNEPEMALVRTLLCKEQIGIDVGANIGLYTLAMADTGARVHAFEPRTDAARRLVETFNGWPVTVHTAALGVDAGEAALFVPKLEGRLVGTRASLREDANRVVEQEALTVNVASLDSFGFSPVGLIKVDVEGCEGLVLEGARATLRRDRPSVICEIEIRHHPEGCKGIFDMMEAAGYSCHFVNRGLLKPIAAFSFESLQSSEAVPQVGASRHADYVNNFIFLPAEREAELLERLHARLASAEN